MLTLATNLPSSISIAQRIPYARLAVVLLLAVFLAACSTTKPVGQGEYRVVKGDTLTQIARKHGQTVDSLRRLNNLRNINDISVGQVLKVAGNSTAAPATVTPTSPAKVGPSLAAPRSIKLIWPAEGKSRRGTTASSSQAVYIAGQRAHRLKPQPTVR